MHARARPSSWWPHLIKVSQVFFREVLYVISYSLVLREHFFGQQYGPGPAKIVINYSPDVITGAKKFGHNSLVLNELGWLTIN